MSHMISRHFAQSAFAVICANSYHLSIDCINAAEPDFTMIVLVRAVRRARGEVLLMCAG